jgi:hypothetical protein
MKRRSVAFVTALSVFCLGGGARPTEIIPVRGFQVCPALSVGGGSGDCACSESEHSPKQKVGTQHVGPRLRLKLNLNVEPSNRTFQNFVHESVLFIQHTAFRGAQLNRSRTKFHNRSCLLYPAKANGHSLMRTAEASHTHRENDEHSSSSSSSSSQVRPLEPASGGRRCFHSSRRGFSNQGDSCAAMLRMVHWASYTRSEQAVPACVQSGGQKACRNTRLGQD